MVAGCGHACKSTCGSCCQKALVSGGLLREWLQHFLRANCLGVSGAWVAFVRERYDARGRQRHPMAARQVQQKAGAAAAEGQGHVRMRVVGREGGRQGRVGRVLRGMRGAYHQH